METRTPVEGYLGSEFPTVCNLCRVNVLCSNLVKFGGLEIGEIVRCLPDKKKNKISPGSPAVATARMAPNICQGQSPTMYSRVLHDFIQICSLSMEL